MKRLDFSVLPPFSALIPFPQTSEGMVLLPRSPSVRTIMALFALVILFEDRLLTPTLVYITMFSPLTSRHPSVFFDPVREDLSSFLPLSLGFLVEPLPLLSHVHPGIQGESFPCGVPANAMSTLAHFPKWKRSFF